MKHISLMLEQDFKLLLRNAIFWVMTATLAAIVLTVNFIIPKDFSASKTDVAVYGLYYDIPGAKTLDSAEAVEQYARDKSALGLVYENGRYTFVHQDLGEKSAAAAAAVLIPPSTALPEVCVSQIRNQNEAVPENIRLTPVFICFEAIILGFLMSAVLMLGEKHEQVLKAYRISPGGTFWYVSSKALLFALIGTIYAVLMAIATVGIDFDWFGFIALSLTGCALYTLLGMCFAVFFRDISGWFMTALVVLSLNMLPAISYSSPAFSSGWVSVIPSYTAIFTYSEILFPTGKGVVVPILILAAEAAAAFILCAALVRIKLLSAGREA